MRRVLRIATAIGLAGASGLWCLFSYLVLGKIVTVVLEPWGVLPLEIFLVTAWRVAAFLLLSSLCLFAFAALQVRHDDDEEVSALDEGIRGLQEILRRAHRRDGRDDRGDARPEVA